MSSSFNPTGFSTTASLYTDGGLRVTKDAYISGTLYLNNVTVYGTQSVCYITSSQLNIASNLISVNTATPSVRFGGLAVYDSGSTGLTGSILWDSENNRWIYSNPSGSTYDGGMFISGPRNSSGLGSETGTTACMLLAGQGGDHLTSSMIYHSSTVTCIPNTLIGGIACFSGQVCGNGATFTTTGNTAVTIASGATGLSRMIFQGTVGNARGFIDYDNSTCGFIIRTNENEAMRISCTGNVGISYTPNPWYATFRALQVGANGSSLFGRSENNVLGLASNGYVNATGNWTYTNTAAAAYQEMLNGEHSWYTAASGTSGTGITFSERFRITNAGAACFACELTAKTLGTNDLILNNLNYECANYVDGTRGSWLIQEGACDLFIINQVSCKKYKFNLIEIK